MQVCWLCNSDGYIRKFRTLILHGMLAAFMVGLVGCSTTTPPAASSASKDEILEIFRGFDSATNTPDVVQTESKANVQAGTGIRDIYLSTGDEIEISVYGRPDLSRRFIVPPNGYYFYPLVGELKFDGQSVRELRKHIATTLGRKQSRPISSGDELSIQVYGHKELDVQCIMPQDGLVQMPLIGELNISGQTPTQAGQTTTEKLTYFIKNPQVTVQVLRYQGTPPISDPQVGINLIRLTGEKLFVLGKVKKPGIYPVSGSVHLLEAIAMAGGTMPDAKIGSVALIRTQPGKTEPEELIIDLDDALTKGSAEANPLLQRGDVVFVPETGLAKTSRVFEHIEHIILPFVRAGQGYWYLQRGIDPINEW